MRISIVIKIVCVVGVAWATLTCAYSQSGGSNETVIWIAMAGRTQLSQVAPGTTLEGKLARSVYWRDTEVFPQGSRVRMVVDKLERRKKSYRVDDRPFVIHLFAPRHEWVANFRAVDVRWPGGAPVRLRAAFIALSQRAELTAQAKKDRPLTGRRPSTDGGVQRKAKARKAAPPWVMTMKAEPEGTTFAALAAERAGSAATIPPACAQPCTIADGTRMHLVLLQGLSAARDHQGQSFRAMLLAPVLAGSALAIPAGSIVQGVLAKRVPPRRLYRPGSLNLLFNQLALPNGVATSIVASPISAEVDGGTHMTMDSEGRIHAQSPGKARFLLDLGVTGGISKVTDDTTQLIIEAISSTATDASTAGVAKIAAMGATAIFMLTRHGRDVILPPFTEMDVSLSRAALLASEPSVGARN